MTRHRRPDTQSAPTLPFARRGGQRGTLCHFRRTASRLPIALSLLVLTACHTSRSTQQKSHTPSHATTTRIETSRSHHSHSAKAAEMLATASQRLGLAPDYRRDNARLLGECAAWIGTPYVYGGNTQRGVDCSGLTLAIYKKVYGKKLHRRSRDQYEKDVRRIRRDDMQQGDLVFFTSPRSGGRVGHVGIYLRDGYFLHASSTRGVVVSHLDGNYYRKHWVGAGRVPDDDVHDPSGAMP